MKKILFSVLLILVLFNCSNVLALSQNELTILNLDKVATANKPLGFTSVQGGVTTDRYVITLLINDDKEYSDNKTAIMVLNKNNYKLARLPKNPIVEYNFGHANDATYNSLTNELLVLCGRKIKFLDLTNDSFKLVKTKKLKHYYHGLGYDEESNQYVLARGIKGGTLFEIRDNEFNVVKKFKLKTNLTKQALTIYKGNIYYVCYEAGMLTKHQKKYDGILKRKENLIYVYNLEGKKKTIYYIPFSYKNVIFGEVENISFNNDKMLIQFNHSSNIGYFTADYKKEIEKTINIKTDTNKEEYNVYHEDEKILKTKSKNHLIPIRLKFKDEGIYKYRIEKKNDTLQNKDLEVEVFYDPAINKLRVLSNSKDLEFSNNDKQIVEVPDTKNNNYLWIIGIIVIFINLIFIKKRVY